MPRISRRPGTAAPSIDPGLKNSRVLASTYIARFTLATWMPRLPAARSEEGVSVGLNTLSALLSESRREVR
jgi:hypothetical protein